MIQLRTCWSSHANSFSIWSFWYKKLLQRFNVFFASFKPTFFNVKYRFSFTMSFKLKLTYINGFFGDVLNIAIFVGFAFIPPAYTNSNNFVYLQFHSHDEATDAHVLFGTFQLNLHWVFCWLWKTNMANWRWSHYRQFVLMHYWCANGDYIPSWNYRFRGSRLARHDLWRLS